VTNSTDQEPKDWYSLHAHVLPAPGKPMGPRHAHHKENQGHGSHEGVPLVTQQEALGRAASDSTEELRIDADANVKWSPEDLDRCDHGRHSIDDCFGCPDGRSTGNMYLSLWVGAQRRGVKVRIGTTLGGKPIFVEPARFRDGETEVVSDGQG
jgi:hypothetical protein